MTMVEPAFFPQFEKGIWLDDDKDDSQTELRMDSALPISSLLDQLTTQQSVLFPHEPQHPIQEIREPPYIAQFKKISGDSRSPSDSYSSQANPNQSDQPLTQPDDEQRCQLPQQAEPAKLVKKKKQATYERERYQKDPDFRAKKLEKGRKYRQTHKAEAAKKRLEKRLARSPAEKEEMAAYARRRYHQIPALREKKLKSLSAYGQAHKVQRAAQEAARRLRKKKQSGF